MQSQSFFLFSRELSLEVLKRDPPGSFIVRSATSKNGLALSVRVPQDFHPEGILNYLIIRAPKGFKIKVHLTGAAFVYHLAGARHS